MRIMTAFFQVGRERNRTGKTFSSFTTQEYVNVPLIGGRPERVNQHLSIRQPETKQLNRQIAASSIVLLKNNGSAFPQTGSESHVAIIGSVAGSNDWGANGCRDKVCGKGTLASLWGSGSWLMPYLITPENALTNYIVENTLGAVSSVTNNYALSQISILAPQVDFSLVFVSASSGEGYITVDGNYGDRKNLTLWNGGEELIHQVALLCKNTIVVIYSVSALNVPSFHTHPNVTAILWSAPAGEQTGNAITDVLYGKHDNPSGKLPFTIAEKRSNYGHELVYEPNNGNNAPQQNLSGLDLDYRRFDAKNRTPVYEFGYGLSYTTFAYANLTITPLDAAAKPYIPTTGLSSPLLRIATNPIDPHNVNVSEYVYPPGIPEYPTFIDPYVTSSNLSLASKDGDYWMDPSSYLPQSALNSSQNPGPRPLHPAGGAPGGNPSLWEAVYKISVSVTNTGSKAGYEVVQLYLSLGQGRPVRVLRELQRVWLEPGEMRVVEMELLRRDVSVWDTVRQDWVIAGEEVVVASSGNLKRRVGVWVGASSRDLRVEGEISQ
jgi:beta-glucosidase